MKRILGLLAIVVIACSCGGPKEQEPEKKVEKLIGTWTATTTVRSQIGEETTEFREDGTYKTVVRITGSGGRVLVANDDGVWKRTDADHIQMTLNDTVWSVEGGDAASQKKVKEQFEAAKKSIIEAANKEPAAKVNWQDDDHFTITENGQSRLFTRKK